MSTNTNRPPVRMLLDGIAAGQTPTSEDWDALNLSPGDLRSVKDAAHQIRGLRQAGNYGAARDIARDTAEQTKTPTERDPIENPPTIDTTTDPDPRTLAADVPRGAN